MRPKSQNHNPELFGILLTSFINKKHELYLLAESIDWKSLEQHFYKYYIDFGRPGLSIRLLVGLHILKYTYKLSDEEVCRRWVENPYYQYFCGELYFRHDLKMERSSMTHFRNRVGSEALDKLLQESLGVAYSVGALDLKSLEKVAVDTTVQAKSVTYPTDGKLLYKAIERLGSVAKEEEIELRQSYIRVGKQALHNSLRYRHAKQHNRAKKCEKKLKTWLGRIIRDIYRKTEIDDRSSNLKLALDKANKIHDMSKESKNRLYSWHAPEVECIAKGKVSKPYEFGCKVSIATNLHSAPGGHFILQAQALHGRPYDGHTLNAAIEHISKLSGKTPKRIFVDKGYTGHNYAEKHNVFKSGQRRGVTTHIKRELKRRSAIEPIIGHAKNEGHLGLNWLKGQEGDRINACLSAAGFNFRQILAWFRLLLQFLYLYFMSAIDDKSYKKSLHSYA